MDLKTFAKIKKKHLGMVRELLEAQAEKILDKPDVQAKWSTIWDTESRLTIEPNFLTHISPLRAQHCSQMKEIKVKITESRNLAYDELKANLEFIKGRTVKNKATELWEKVYDQSSSY